MEPQSKNPEIEGVFPITRGVDYPDNNSMAIGGVNYSPKHSTCPAGSNSRNINFKNLQLEINTLNTKPSSTTNPLSSAEFNYNGHAILPKLTTTSTLPTINILDNISSPVLSSLIYVNSSDNSPSLQSPLPSKSYDNGVSMGPSLRIALTPIFKRHINDTSTLKGQQSYNPTNSNTDDSSLVINKLGVQTLKLNEELQEKTAVNAYPDGPANVLNSTLYLYSDPYLSEKPIDINDYDLVLNVAKECKDLSSAFNTFEGKRRYVHIPWSHTSSILEQLPDITKQLSEMDKPGKKTLIHCQCGVLRSACVIVAYFMVKFNLNVNEAYELLKSGTTNQNETVNNEIEKKGHFVQACEKICPNMNLIFELMDFGEKLKLNSIINPEVQE